MLVDGRLARRDFELGQSLFARAEQHRIIAKVGTLMAFIYPLHPSLTVTANRFFDTVLIMMPDTAKPDEMEAAK